MSSPAAPSRAAILVVDDDLDNREILSRQLRRKGYAVSTAVDGPDALRQIAQSPFDLVLLDVMMPQMSGFEVLQSIRQQYAPSVLPVIMATAKDRSEDIVGALEMGASDYVAKPLDFPVVAARVKTQLLLKQSMAQIMALEKSLQRRNAELEAANAQLLDAAQRTRRELEAAARVQLALLPTTPPAVSTVQCGWFFRPCQELAGDALNVFAINAEHVGFFVLDVSGHGLPASLLAVAATRLLADAQDLAGATGHPGECAAPASPADVAGRLNRAFSWSQQTDQFLTMFYGVLHIPSRQLSYVSAGHPPAVLQNASGDTSLLESTGMPLGVGESFSQAAVQLEPHERIYVYSDGLTETLNRSEGQFGLPRVRANLSGTRASRLDAALNHLLEDVNRWRGDGPVTDDISVVALECE